MIVQCRISEETLYRAAYVLAAENGIPFVTLSEVIRTAVEYYGKDVNEEQTQKGKEALITLKKNRQLKADRTAAEREKLLEDLGDIL